ncbi:hypothetical protein ADEAN_000659000 [Angomonas deanei]|uniref:Uncharacterized protein n=1 Tax=Angomonas deanei TaxID=59799 RepID=A0A7G2CJ65_9TRYP|nr:hypothetical protein ADEAN_000659000 [Angomonas deanei]
MQWDPKSYVAEVLVSGRAGEASETPSYYDYLKATLERKQNHDALREALDDEQSRTHHIKVHLPGGIITASSFEKYSDDEAEEFESFVNRCAQQLRETQAISDHVGDSLSLFLLQRAEEFFAGKPAFEESLIQLGNFYFSLRGAPKYLYPLEAAPIPGDSEPYITKIISVAGRCLWHRIFSIQDQSVTIVSLAIEGDCARIVAETADECTRLNSYAEVEVYLSKSRSEGKIHNFFLQNSGGSETNSFEDDVPEEQVTSNTNTPENLFNFQAHLFQAVKTGNTADAFHQLENKHNQAIYTDTINLCNRLPQAETAITVLSRSGDLLAQKPTGFQRLGGLLFSFSIPSYSPLYNYVLESGTPLLFNFVEPGVLEKKSSWWVSSQSDESKMWKSTTLKIAKEFFDGRPQYFCYQIFL